MFQKLFLSFLLTLAIANSISANTFLDSNKLPSPQNVTMECGGLVTITATDNPSISYKRGVPYASNERCVWTILPESELMIQSIIIVVEFASFAPTDGLVLYWWSNNGDFLFRKILTTDIGQALTINNSHHAFLAFSSSQGGATGLGFKADIIGVESDIGSIPSQVEHFQYSNCFPTFYLPKFPAVMYKPDERLSIVLQPTDATSATSLKFGYVDLEDTRDTVRVYDLLPYNANESLFLEATITGSHWEGLNATETTEPRILLFSTDGSSQKRGFYFDWY